MALGTRTSDRHAYDLLALPIPAQIFAPARSLRGRCPFVLHKSHPIRGYALGGITLQNVPASLSALLEILRWSFDRSGCCLTDTTKAEGNRTDQNDPAEAKAPHNALSLK